VRRPVKRALMYLVLGLLAVIYVYPFLLGVGTAFKTNADASAHPLSPLPGHWVVSAFTELGQQDFARWLANSVVVAVLVTAGRLLFDSMAGYALARLRFRGRGAVFAAVIAVMAVPGVVLLIPKFLILKQLSLYNSYPGLVLPLLTDAAGVFIMRQFFLSVHPSIEEAAKIDGAGIFRTYWSVVLPMARPALLTLMILSFQGSWNDFSTILVAHQSPSLDTLTTGVGRLVSGQLGAATQYPLELAAAMAMTIPVAIVFFVFQKYIMRTGEGAVKELPARHSPVMRILRITSAYPLRLECRAAAQLLEFAGRHLKVLTWCVTRSGCVPNPAPAPRSRCSCPHPTKHPPAQVARPATPHGDGQAILVVDDDDAMRDVVTRMLTRASYQVIAAATATDALEITTNPAIDINALLTDVVMPDMSGVQLAERTRDHRNQLPGP
jgi:multiple sugar transport system permease protein